jgi:hypothetical protein
VVQFVAGRFRGYRYLDGGERPLAPTRSVLRSVRPRLSTATGISLGSSLADARRSYGVLRRVGTAFYRTRSGITFALWSSGTPARKSRIHEIKSNVCRAEKWSRRAYSTYKGLGAVEKVIVLESLSPAQRSAFLLHDVFGY